MKFVLLFFIPSFTLIFTAILKLIATLPTLQVPYDIVKFLLPVIPYSRRYEAFSKLDKSLLTLPMGSLVNISRGRQNTTVVGEVCSVYTAHVFINVSYLKSPFASNSLLHCKIIINSLFTRFFLNFLFPGKRHLRDN